MAQQLIPRLQDFSVQMRQLGDHLHPYEGELGEENVAYVRDTAEALVEILEGMAAEAGNPLQGKEARHDMRNRIAVIKGFADLILMDLDPSHVVAPSLKQLTSLSDRFCAELDAVKGEDVEVVSPEDIFAS